MPIMKYIILVVFVKCGKTGVFGITVLFSVLGEKSSIWSITALPKYRIRLNPKILCMPAKIRKLSF